MEVIVAEKCGFCNGVENAISMATKVLSEKHTVYSLGSIIHNRDMVQRLAEKGLETISDIEEIDAGTVLIRSHGAAPEQIQKIQEKGLDIVDATCVLVKRVQQIAKELEEDGFEVVIIGDKDHPEVQAVVGCVSNVVVVANKEDIHRLPSNKKLGVVCQTTQSPEHYGDMVGEIVKGGFREIKVINTLCREAIKRQQSAVDLCQKVDVMFVLGGLESANTKKLAELCKKYNNNTFHLQNFDEFDKKTVLNKSVAGVTAGASTPRWIIEEFVDKLKLID